MVIMILTLNYDNLCEEAFGRDGHGHVRKTKETHYFKTLLPILRILGFIPTKPIKEKEKVNF